MKVKNRSQANSGRERKVKLFIVKKIDSRKRTIEDQQMERKYNDTNSAKIKHRCMNSVIAGKGSVEREKGETLN